MSNTSKKPIGTFRAPLCLIVALATSTTSRAAMSDELARYRGAEVSSARLMRALDRADPRHPLSEEALQALVAYGSFVELLPLERVVGVRGLGERIEVLFDCGRRDHLDVELPDREEWVLDRKDGDLRRGKATQVCVKGQTLRIRSELQLYVHNGEIVSVRKGDIQIVAGLFKVDLELSTHREPGRLARDGRGRILIARDPAGGPAAFSGEWVPQRFERWVRVAARGEELWIGVEPPRSAGPYLAMAADS